MSIITKEPLHGRVREAAMSSKLRISNYSHLLLQATFVYLTLNFLRSILHEMGHGVAASLVGMKFIGLYASVFGSSLSFNVGPRPPIPGAITAFGGPLIDLCIGLATLFLILPRSKRWGPKLWALLLAGATLLAFWGYMMAGAFGSGDFAYIAAALGVPKSVFGIAGLLGLVGFLYLLIQRIFGALSDYFPLNTFSRRFGSLYVFLGFPTTVYVAGLILASPRFSLLGQLVFVIAFLALLSVLIRSSSDRLRPLPALPTPTGAIAFVAACAIWLGLFGPTYPKAKGLVWGPVEESSVAVCNIHLRLDKDLTAYVEFLARPVAHRLFWKKLEGRVPNWSFYERFIDRNLPLFLGVEDYTVLETTTDPDTPIYFGSAADRLTGSRKVSISTSLGQVMQEVGPSTLRLELVDFWRVAQRGYIDRLEIVVPSGMQFMDYEVEPIGAAGPDHFDRQSLVWENDDYSTAPEKIRVTVAAAPAEPETSNRAATS